MMRSKTILISLMLLACSGCTSHINAYRMDVRQGNFVTPEMREKLKLGMTKQQVRFVMGTPLLNDAFHGNRWDYMYSLAKRGSLVEQQGMTLYFEGDNLTRIEDAAMPAIPAAVIEPPASAVMATSAAPVAVSSVAVVPVLAAPVQSAVEVEPAVKASVQAWAAAWSARDNKRYLAAYAGSFKPPAGMSYVAWQKQRQARIAKAHTISVLLSDVAIKVQDDTHAVATFMQDYRSDAYHDSTRKILELEKIAGAWLIVSEQSE